MDVELITIGDEIISGHTVDTNSVYIAAKLGEIGLWVTYKTSVGDDLRRMEEVILQALKRADLVITTGGLGPTDDDITKRAIVKVFKRNLVFHEDVLEDIKKRYEARAIKMPSINQNQALLPQGAVYLPNKTGSAVGVVIVEGTKIFAALPGVPREMETMVAEELVPFLTGRVRQEHIRVIKLRTTGIIESALAEKIMPITKLPESIRLAYLPSYGGVDLRIVSFGPTKEMATAPAENMAKQIRELVGSYIYGEDNDTLEGVIGRLLKEKKETLATAESCTAGLLAGQITAVPGSSEYFERGVVTYSDRSKMELLGVSENIIRAYGAVSTQTAEAMATGIREKAGVDYGVAITGIAGPDGGTEEKPVGTVFIAVASAKTVKSKKFTMGGDREINRRRSVYTALEFLRRTILGID
ncbi:MAG: competence/damage-inducible protein A [candidate division Zixibacteria bacterium]|nr:competence/damage-inducible protein A [candidate division Zixibacteria bacterium]